MHAPISEFGATEDGVTRAFKAAKAFRDALQALISVCRTAGFTIGLETEESTATAEVTAAPPSRTPAS